MHFQYLAYHSRHRLGNFISLAIAAMLFAVPQMARAANSKTIQGNVHSGSSQTAIPLPGALVRLYRATNEAPELLGTTTADAAGNFSLKAMGAGSGGIYYATADVGENLQLVSVIGQSLSGFTTINELTTVAAGYSMAQFTNDGVVSGDPFALQLAAGMNDNLVARASGDSSPVMLSSPNANQTNSLRASGSLANMLALFVRNGGQDVDSFFALATPPGGTQPANFLQALSNIDRFPQDNVGDLYDLATQVLAFSPSLIRMPDAWTLAVKVNDSGDDNYLFGGPGTIAFDSSGYAWITNNVTQGTPNSSQFGIVLKPNGTPADGTNGTPTSPLFGGGLLGGGFGVDVAPNGHVWFGNFGWGLPRYHPSYDGNGSVSEFTRNGTAISGDLGYQGGPLRAQAVVADANGNIWIASFGNDRVYVFLKGNPNRSISYQEPQGSAPFGIDFAPDGSAWVSNSGGLKPNGQGSVARYILENNQLTQVFLTTMGHSNKGVVVDSYGDGWMASGNDDFVYRFDPQGNLIGQYNGGGMDGPWGITVDGDDNIWVANFGPLDLKSDFHTGNLTKLAGNNPDTRPPGLNTGDPISPPTGYTLPSAGEQVLLHNGKRLYGNLRIPSFSPLMRVTGVVIDRAGNAWLCNNWKPIFLIDVFNSGGDGIVIYVGVAKPPRLKQP